MAKSGKKRESGQILNWRDKRLKSGIVPPKSAQMDTLVMFSSIQPNAGEEDHHSFSYYSFRKLSFKISCVVIFKTSTFFPQS